MLSLIRRSPPEQADPGALRAAREAFGWSQERLAEEMCVLPAEVAAWESGAIALDAYRAEVMRWRMEHAEYLARLPRSECYWTRANRDRLKRMEEVGPYSARRAQREVAAHVRECGECLRIKALLRDVAAPPEPPLRPGLRGWLQARRHRFGRWPAWLRVPAEIAAAVTAAGTAYTLLSGMIVLAGPEAGFRWWLVGAAAGAVGLGWLMYLSHRLEGLSLRWPYAGAAVTAAGLAVPVNLVLGLLGYVDVTSSGSWLFVLVIVLTFGWLWGNDTARDLAQEAAALEPSRDNRDTESDGERVVYIRQQDTSRRP